MNVAKLGLLLSLSAAAPAWAGIGDKGDSGIIVESTTDEGIIVESTTDETCARIVRPQRVSGSRQPLPITATAWVDWYRNEIFGWLLQLLLR